MRSRTHFLNDAHIKGKAKEKKKTYRVFNSTKVTTEKYFLDAVANNLYTKIFCTLHDFIIAFSFQWLTIFIEAKNRSCNFSRNSLNFAHSTYLSISLGRLPEFSTTYTFLLSQMYPGAWQCCKWKTHTRVPALTLTLYLPLFFYRSHSCFVVHASLPF